MTYKEILRMVGISANNAFSKGLNYDGIQKTIVECATNIYIKQMELEKEKLQQEYDDLYEGHDKLCHEWALLKKENKELKRKCNENIYVAESNGTNLANYQKGEKVNEHARIK